MFIKHHAGDGIWHLDEVACGLEYLGPHSLIEVRAVSGGVGQRTGLVHSDGSDFWARSSIPDYDTEPRIHLVSERPDGTAFVRWVRWVDHDGDAHILVTDAPVFIENDRGDTLEALRDSPGEVAA